MASAPEFFDSSVQRCPSSADVAAAPMDSTMQTLLDEMRHMRKYQVESFHQFFRQELRLMEQRLTAVIEGRCDTMDDFTSSASVAAASTAANSGFAWYNGVFNLDTEPVYDAYGDDDIFHIDCDPVYDQYGDDGLDSSLPHTAPVVFMPIVAVNYRQPLGVQDEDPVRALTAVCDFDDVMTPASTAAPLHLVNKPLLADGTHDHDNVHVPEVLSGDQTTFVGIELDALANCSTERPSQTVATKGPRSASSVASPSPLDEPAETTMKLLIPTLYRAVVNSPVPVHTGAEASVTMCAGDNRILQHPTKEFTSLGYTASLSAVIMLAEAPFDTGWPGAITIFAAANVIWDPGPPQQVHQVVQCLRSRTLQVDLMHGTAQALSIDIEAASNDSMKCLCILMIFLTFGTAGSIRGTALYTFAPAYVLSDALILWEQPAEYSDWNSLENLLDCDIISPETWLFFTSRVMHQFVFWVWNLSYANRVEELERGFLSEFIHLHHKPPWPPPRTQEVMCVRTARWPVPWSSCCSHDKLEHRRSVAAILLHCYLYWLFCSSYGALAISVGVDGDIQMELSSLPDDLNKCILSVVPQKKAATLALQDMEIDSSAPELFIYVIDNYRGSKVSAHDWQASVISTGALSHKQISDRIVQRNAYLMVKYQEVYNAEDRSGDPWISLAFDVGTSVMVHCWDIGLLQRFWPHPISTVSTKDEDSTVGVILQKIIQPTCTTHALSEDVQWSFLKKFIQARGFLMCCAEPWAQDHNCAPTIQLQALQKFWDLTDQGSSFDSGSSEHILLALSQASWYDVESVQTLQLDMMVSAHDGVVLWTLSWPYFCCNKMERRFQLDMLMDNKHWKFCAKEMLKPWDPGISSFKGGLSSFKQPHEGRLLLKRSEQLPGDRQHLKRWGMLPMLAGVKTKRARRTWEPDAGSEFGSQMQMSAGRAAK